MNSNVYRSPYGELYLCHSGYKYLNREWKNGRWHYTYPNYKDSDIGRESKEYISRLNKHANNYNSKMNEKLNDYNRQDNLRKEMNLRSKLANDKTIRDLYNKAASDYTVSQMLSKQTRKNYESMRNIASRMIKQEKYRSNKNEALYASQTRDLIKKWESTPISKIQTAYHKAADKVNSLLSKVKNKLVSVFTPKETVRMTTTDPSSGYRSATVKKK